MRRTRLPHIGPVAALLPILLLAATPAARGDEHAPPLDAAAAAPAEGVVAKIDRLYGELRVDEANVECLVAIDAGGHSLATHADLLFSCAVVSATLGEGERTDRLCRASLSLSPDRMPSADATPRIVEAFDAATTWWSERPPLTITHTPPPSGTGGDALVMKVAVEHDPVGMVSGARVNYRRADGAWISTPIAPRADRDILVPVPATGSVTYYIAATDSHGSVVWQLGSADAPLVTTGATRPKKSPRPKDGKPIYRKWWFWAAGGGALAAVVIGITAGAVAARPSSATFVFEVSDR